MIKLELVAEGFTAPIGLLSPPDGTGRRFIVEETGLIQILLPDGTLLAEPFLDIRARVNELLTTRNDPRGLLGLAFHPHYQENGRFFVFYTTPPEAEPDAAIIGHVDHIDVVAEFHVSASDPNAADLTSERVLLRVNQNTIEHSAGQLIFGSDGYLYIAFGDDIAPEDTSQNVHDWRGGILRIDVDTTSAPGASYVIPADNPYVGKPGRDEIYAKGLRHPWRLSHDPVTGAIYVCDPAWVFRNSRVSILYSGANYGWNLPGDLGGSHGVTLTPPILDYDSTFGKIIIGGHVYRGKAIPELAGKFVGGEWGFDVPGGAKLFTGTPGADIHARWQFAPLDFTPKPQGDTVFWSIGQDAAGELYVLTMGGPAVVPDAGRVYKIVPA